MVTIARSLAAGRIDAYLEERTGRSSRGRGPRPPVLPAIALSRESGIPGRRIAERAAAALGFEVFDREVLEAVAASSHLGDRIIESLDEGKRSALDAWIAGFLQYDRRIVDPGSFHHMVSRVIRGIALHGSAVIVGRGSPFILKGTGAFRVRLIAPLAVRAADVAAGAEGRPPVPLERARAEVLAREGERRRFIRKNFGVEIADPANYDATFNLRSLDQDLAAGLIIDAYRRISGPRSSP